MRMLIVALLLLSTRGAAHADDTRTFEDEAIVLRKLLEEERYSEVETRLQSHLDEKRRTRGGSSYAELVFRNMIGDPPSPSLRRAITWIKARPKSAFPHAFAAKAQFAVAIRMRGTRVIGETTEAQLTKFARASKSAMKQVDRAILLDSENVLPLITKMRIVNATSGLDSEVEYLFEKAAKIDPGNLQVYSGRLMSLLPKWGGTIEHAMGFAHYHCKEQSPENPAFHNLVVYAHMEMACLAESPQSYYSHQSIYEGLSPHYERLIQSYPAASLYREQYLQFGRYSGRADDVQEFLDAHPLASEE